MKESLLVEYSLSLLWIFIIAHENITTSVTYLTYKYYIIITIVVFRVFFYYYHLSAWNAAACFTKTFYIFEVKVVDVCEILWTCTFAHAVSIH